MKRTDPDRLYITIRTDIFGRARGAYDAIVAFDLSVMSCLWTRVKDVEAGLSARRGGGREGREANEGEREEAAKGEIKGKKRCRQECEGKKKMIG